MFSELMRLRIRFSKTDAMRFIGHLDLFRSWERTFRRSGLPLAYSLGFHPQPRLNLACALPLGMTSECEIIDAWLECSSPLPDVRRSFASVLPPGIEILGLDLVPAQAPALQTQVISAVYVITLLDMVPDLDGQVDRIITAGELLRCRRDKGYDLRQLVENLTIIPPTDAGQLRLRTQLAARECATGRPEELLDEMGIRFADTRVHREQLIFSIA